MRILFISNFYPPHHRGGYGMLCQEVATYLSARGHQVDVLTSTYGVTGELDEPGVYRRLRLESDVNYYRPQQALRYWANRRSNLQVVKDLITGMGPDVVVIWGMWNLSRLVAVRSEELAGSRVVYYLADTWPALPSEHEAYWDDATADSSLGKAFKWTFRLPVRLMMGKEWRPFPLRFENVLACSQSVRDELLKAGLPMHHTKIVYHGIDPVPYQKAAERRALNSRPAALRVVYVGALLPKKGVHTVIEAIGHFVEMESKLSIELTVLGSGHPDYERELQELVKRWDLDKRISFHRPIPRAELPSFLARFDVLVLPSVYEEPQARISQEAMASGLVLVATQTGGTKEILVDGENGLAFRPEDPRGLAVQLQKLAADDCLREQLASAAWQTVTERFTIERMINDIEAYLTDVVTSTRLA